MELKDINALPPVTLAKSHKVRDWNEGVTTREQVSWLMGVATRGHMIQLQGGSHDPAWPVGCLLCNHGYCKPLPWSFLLFSYLCSCDW